MNACMRRLLTAMAVMAGLGLVLALAGDPELLPLLAVTVPAPPL